MSLQRAVGKLPSMNRVRFVSLLLLIVAAAWMDAKQGDTMSAAVEVTEARLPPDSTELREAPFAEQGY